MDSSVFSNPYVELRLLRDICRGSLYQFCKEFWDLVVTEPAHWNWHMEYLCQKMQDIAEDAIAGKPKKYDLVISLPPATGKSTILSVLFPAWIHAQNPRFRFITASFNYTLATEFGRRSKLVMDSPLYRKLFWSFKYTPERAGHYTNQYGGERMVFSTGQSPTGRHANLIICDDPIDPQDAGREIAIRDTTFWLNAVVRSRSANVENTPLVLVMQRLHQRDPVGEWLEHKDAKIFHISLPAEVDSYHKPVPVGLSRYYREGLLDPVRLSRKALNDRKAWMSQADYESQYLQNPLAQEGLLFKVEGLQCRMLDQLDPIDLLCRYWDKALSVSDTACFTAGVKLGKTRSGRWFILDVKRGKWGLYDRENLIRNTAMQDGYGCTVVVEQEPGPIFEDEQILMGDGKWCPLKDIVVGDFVINKRGEATEVLQIHRQGGLFCKKIITRSGRKLIAADDHPILTPNGFEKMGDLRVGGYVAAMHDKYNDAAELAQWQAEVEEWEKGQERMMFSTADLRRYIKKPPPPPYSYVADEITSIIDEGILPCRCLTVKNGESFVANEVIVHNSGGKESADNTVRNLAGFMAYADPASLSKELRARPFAIQVEQGNVCMLPANWNDEFVAELAAFPQGKYKDQVDAVVGAFNWMARMNVRVVKAY